MNQEDVRTMLASLHSCREEFTVVFSGRKSGKINGTYRPYDRRILINNRNFTGEDGRTNEPSLFYTAMHELAHHIQHTEYGQEGARSHTKLFYAILDSLAEKAEKAGICQPEADAELDALIGEARAISEEIARLQKKLGATLDRLRSACVRKGARFEDAVKRKVRISMESANTAMRISSLDLPDSLGIDLQAAIAGERDIAQANTMLVKAQEGQSVAQVRQSLAPVPSREPEADALLREKGRIEKTIKMLQRRLEDIMERLTAPGGQSPPCAAERI